MRQIIEGRRVGPFTPTGICRITEGTLRGEYVITTKEERTVAVRVGVGSNPFPSFAADLVFISQAVIFHLDEDSYLVGFEVPQ